RPLRILLVEDNVANQKLAMALLKKRGHTVVAAGDGQEALSVLQNQPFDLVLMDWQMPRMTGLEATAALRKREKTTGGHIPIIALMGNGMKGDRERCLQAGMDDYVAKPVRAAELFEAIERLAPTGPAIPASASQRQDTHVALDEAATLELVEGNRGLLK